MSAVVKTAVLQKWDFLRRHWVSQRLATRGEIDYAAAHGEWLRTGEDIRTPIADASGSSLGHRVVWVECDLCHDGVMHDGAEHAENLLA